MERFTAQRTSRLEFLCGLLIACFLFRINPRVLTVLSATRSPIF
jgi:hypothetical protein